jgi:hypothetical protein
MLNESYNIMRENDKFLEEFDGEEYENDRVEPLMDTLINLKYKVSGSVKSSMIMSSSKHL